MTNFLSEVIIQIVTNVSYSKSDYEKNLPTASMKVQTCHVLFACRDQRNRAYISNKPSNPNHSSTAPNYFTATDMLSKLEPPKTRTHHQPLLKMNSFERFWLSLPHFVRIWLCLVLGFLFMEYRIYRRNEQDPVGERTIGEFPIKIS